jgi:single-strand DNA-binding protein
MSRRCVNKAELIGFVGRDPEVRYTPSGDAVASLSIGTSETWTDKNKEEQERTEWHRCVAFGKFAENVVGKLPKKGSYVRVEGKIRTRKWQDKDKVDRYTTEIVVDDLIMLDPAPTEKAPAGAPPETEDVPF